MATRKVVPESSDSPGKLRAGEPTVIARLAAGDSQVNAAKAAGLTDRCVRDWLADSAFRQKVTEARTALIDSALGVLSGGARDAADYLVGVAKGDKVADNGRINAARLVLILAPSLRESAELADEVARLAALVDAQQGPARRAA